MQLMIRQNDLNGIIKAAEKSEVEVCGFLFGRREGETFKVEEVYFVTNRLNSPTEFEMDPLEMAKGIDEAERKGLEVVGVFHSHPQCPPRPSGRDLEGMEVWPVVWLIVDGRGRYGAYVLRNEKVEGIKVGIRNC